MPFDLKAYDYDAWEIYPSTRDNTRIWDKWVPVDVTLTTPGTAQNLYLINPDYPTVNIAENPSFETGAPPTGYTASGAALAQSAVVARTGTNSLRITPNNVAAGEGAYWVSPHMGGPTDSGQANYLVASAYFNDNAGSGNGARVVITDNSGVTLANGNTVILAAAWNRSIARVLLTQAEAIYRVYFVTATQFATVFYVDSFQAEINRSGNATTYCDGAQGNFYEWDSTAHASMSRRRAGLLTIRGYNLYNTRNCYIAFDQTASSTLGRYIKAGTDFWTEHPLNIKKYISFINELAGEQPRIYGEVLGTWTGRA